MSFTLKSNFFANARGLTFEDGGGLTWSFNSNTNEITANGSGAGASGANPTAKVGLAAVNGSATTFMRSDAAPPVDQTITPTWTGLHTFTGGITVTGTITLDAHTLSLTGNASVSGTNTGDQVIPTAANPTGTVGLSAVNGLASTFMRSDGAPALSQAISPTWTGNHVFAAGSGLSVSITGTANHNSVFVQASTTTSESFGIQINAGTNSSDAALTVYNASGGSTLFSIAGDGGITLGAPTGGDKGAGTLNAASGLYVAGTAVSTASGANPSGSVGLSAVNGSSTSFMRADAAPALSQSIAPTWTGVHTFSPSSGVAVTINGVASTNALVVTSTAVSNGAIIKLTNQATTGTQTASFSATNKPGASSGSPQKWLMINLDGTQYYIPAFD